MNHNSTDKYTQIYAVYRPKVTLNKTQYNTRHKTHFMICISFYFIKCNRLSIYCIQGVPRLVAITAGGDFLGLCDEKSSYKHVSDFGRLRSYDRLKLRIEGNDY